MVLSADGLWELFLQTGIPEAYIAYAREKQKETEQILHRHGLTVITVRGSRADRSCAWSGILMNQLESEQQPSLSAYFGVFRERERRRRSVQRGRYISEKESSNGAYYGKRTCDP